MLAFDVVDRLRQISPGAANWVLSSALPQIIPLAGGLGIRVEEVTDLRAVASLPLKRRTRNHVGSIYFGAQMTLMELTMGLLLFKRYPPGPYGVLVKRVEADFHAKAKGRVTAVCEPGAEMLSDFTSQLAKSGDKVEDWVSVQLSAGPDLVTEARFLAAIKRF